MQASDIIQFWFEDTDSSFWWKKDVDFDTKIREHFSEIHQAATRCELFSWRTTGEGRLAEIIVLDQFSRNMFRNDPRSFAYDTMALTLAQEAVSQQVDQNLSSEMKAFLYLPYMHSESLKIHNQAVQLYSQEGLEYNLDFENKHRDIILRFGRYPHRNAILGRTSTKEEIQFLKEPGSSF